MRPLYKALTALVVTAALLLLGGTRHLLWLMVAEINRQGQWQPSWFMDGLVAAGFYLLVLQVCQLLLGAVLTLGHWTDRPVLPAWLRAVIKAGLRKP